MLKKISQKEIYQDQWLKLYQDEVELPDGSPGTYAWVNRKNGVGIVVVTTDNKILLNLEYRYVINKFSWEIPGGGIDEGETEEEAAFRELKEETGLTVKKLENIGVFYPLNSFNTESVTYFYTTIDPSPLTTSQTESGEHVETQKYVTFSEALQMIDSGDIDDALTANIIQKVIRTLQTK